jgi:hypothetical protein
MEGVKEKPSMRVLEEVQHVESTGGSSVRRRNRNSKLSSTLKAHVQGGLPSLLRCALLLEAHALCEALALDVIGLPSRCETSCGIRRPLSSEQGKHSIAMYSLSTHASKRTSSSYNRVAINPLRKQHIETGLASSSTSKPGCLGLHEHRPLILVHKQASLERSAPRDYAGQFHDEGVEPCCTRVRVTTRSQGIIAVR